MPSTSCQYGENDAPRSSGWVEDFLIEFYLEGSSGVLCADGATELRAEDEENMCFDSDLSEKVNGTDIETQKEFRIVAEDVCEPQHQQVEALVEDEKLLEAWQAQYGQVVRSDEEAEVCPRAISLWNWSTIVSKRKCRLLGQLAHTSSRLHHSLQHHNGFIKTTDVCEVNLDLVKVSSGEIYRLRQPSLKYLSSISSYDSSNPTKGWNFPCITLSGLEETTEQSENAPCASSKLSPNYSVVKPFIPNWNHRRYHQLREKKISSPVTPVGLRALSGGEIALAEERKRKYRDRAKERRECFGDDKEECEYGMHQELSSLANDIDNAREEKSKRTLTGSHMLERMGWSEISRRCF